MAAHFKVIWLHLCNGTHPIRYFTCCCRFTENLLCILKIKHIYLLHTVGQLCVQKVAELLSPFIRVYAAPDLVV